MLGGDARDLSPETSGPCANDLPPHRDSVGGRHRGRGLEPLLQAHVLPVEAMRDDPNADVSDAVDRALQALRDAA